MQSISHTMLFTSRRKHSENRKDEIDLATLESSNVFGDYSVLLWLSAKVEPSHA